MYCVQLHWGGEISNRPSLQGVYQTSPSSQALFCVTSIKSGVVMKPFPSLSKTRKASLISSSISASLNSLLDHHSHGSLTPISSTSPLVFLSLNFPLFPLFANNLSILLNQITFHYHNQQQDDQNHNHHCEISHHLQLWSYPLWPHLWSARQKGNKRKQFSTFDKGLSSA